MRGEHYVMDIVTLMHVGSSPHARGALRDDPSERVKYRIIPACAGSTTTDLFVVADT